MLQLDGSTHDSLRTFPSLPPGAAPLIALLVVLLFAFLTNPVAAASPNGTTANVVFADLFHEFLANRSRMIQVAAVIVVVGFFLLTKNYR